MSDYPCQMAKHIHRFEDSRTLVESLTAPRRLCLNPLRRRQRPRAPGLALIRPWWARIRTGVEAPRTSPSYSATTTPSTSAIPWGPAQSRGRRTRCPIGECPHSSLSSSSGIRVRLPGYRIEGLDAALLRGFELWLVSYRFYLDLMH